MLMVKALQVLCLLDEALFVIIEKAFSIAVCHGCSLTSVNFAHKELFHRDVDSRR